MAARSKFKANAGVAIRLALCAALSPAAVWLALMEASEPLPAPRKFAAASHRLNRAGAKEPALFASVVVAVLSRRTVLPAPAPMGRFDEPAASAVMAVLPPGAPCGRAPPAV